MADSILVFPPGFRVLNTAGEPVSGAKIKFREVGPGATKPVYSDETLSTTLGHTVRTRSDGFPVVSFGSEVTTLIYVGSAAYYIEITDANDVAIFPAKDNVKGAVDTSDFLTSAASLTLNMPVLSVAAPLTAAAAHKGKCLNVIAGPITLDSAITLGDGWNVVIRNGHASNRQRIIASQSIATPMGAVTSFALRPGESVFIKSNGATFVSSFSSPPFLTATIGVIEIVDRVSAEPGAPTAGDRYIATGAFNVNSGALAIATGDIIEATGGSTWFKIRPPSDAGWIAWVTDENRYYHFEDSAWVAGTEPNATTAVAGLVQLADQAAMEAKTALRGVTADVIHHAPGVNKFWGLATVAGGVPSLVASENITSITDTATGRLTVTIANDFSGVNWASWGMAENVGTEAYVINIAPGTRAAGSAEFTCRDSTSDALSDPTSWAFGGVGDL